MASEMGLALVIYLKYNTKIVAQLVNDCVYDNYAELNFGLIYLIVKGGARLILRFGFL